MDIFSGSLCLFLYLLVMRKLVVSFRKVGGGSLRTGNGRDLETVFLRLFDLKR